MSIIDSNISNITSTEDDFSFNIVNSFEYEFDENTDAFFNGFNRPVGVVGSLTESQKDNYINDGFIAKLVATENVTVEVFADHLDNIFNSKTVQINYYIQTKSTSTGGGGTDDDGGGDGIIRDDIREDIR